MSKYFTAIVLAAGKGKRMKSPLPKVLHPLGGHALVYYVLKELYSLSEYVRQIIVVVEYKNEQVKIAVQREIASFDTPSHKKCILEFVHQKKTLGTAHAVQCTAEKVKQPNVLVLCADTPLIKKRTLSRFMASFLRRKKVCSVISAMRNDNNDLGKVIRDKQGVIKAIREKIDGTVEKFREVNSGIYCFKREALFTHLPLIKKNKKKREYFLTDVIALLYGKGYSVGSYLVKEKEEILGINTQEELLRAQEVLQAYRAGRFIKKGVRLIDPRTTFIADRVSIGKGSVIYPFTFIEKNVIIGSNCSVGPFVRLREGTFIGNNTRVGNFVEICRSRLGQKVKIKHFGYIGDTLVGDNVNIGAGTVVANFDGKNKHKTVIKEDAFIGSDSILVAPVTIGKGSFTGAGSVVTKDVHSHTIVVGVPARTFNRDGKKKNHRSPGKK